jgi:hypothetical protein
VLVTHPAVPEGFMKSCPNCGVSVQVGAQFCGQCGYNLAPFHSPSETSNANDFPAPLPPNPQLTTEDSLTYVLPMPSLAERSEMQQHLAEGQAPNVTEDLRAEAPNSPFATHSAFATQIQLRSARLVHLQSNTSIELPQHLSPLHIGKPNRDLPPDIDVAGFAHSEVVSRIHADICIESGHFFIEDVGSSNGTYINSIPLRPRHQHQLRSGDRIALGKGDLVTFLFQLD